MGRADGIRQRGGTSAGVDGATTRRAGEQYITSRFHFAPLISFLPQPMFGPPNESLIIIIMIIIIIRCTFPFIRFFFPSNFPPRARALPSRLSGCRTRAAQCYRARWSTTSASEMASPPAGSSREARVPPPVAAGAPVDTAHAHLDRLVGMALTAAKSGRYALAAAFYRYAADEARRLHGDTFVCTYLTLERSEQLGLQSQLEGVTDQELAALRDEARTLVSSCLPFIVRRMDANTMLPGRGTAAEMAFLKWFETNKNATFDWPPVSTRCLQLIGLFMGYATAVLAADLLLTMLALRHNIEAQAFVLHVVDSMLPAVRSLKEYTFGEEIHFAATVQQALSGAFPKYDAAFIASLRAKWTATAMVQMRRDRRLLDASERVEIAADTNKTRWHADIAEHSLKRCAVPSCDKQEASVQQYKCCSACRSVWYCSEEHGPLHWAEHMPVCRTTTAAQQAADDAGAGAA